MGHVIPNKEKSLFLEGSYLAGFTTAIGARGIMVLRTVSENGHVSAWLGNLDGPPVSSARVCMRNRIKTLREYFDANLLSPFSHPPHKQLTK